MVELTDIINGVGYGVSYLFAAGGVVLIGVGIYKALEIYKEYKIGIKLETIRNKKYEQEMYLLRANKGFKPIRGISPSPMPKRGTGEWWDEVKLYIGLEKNKKKVA
jgi:hypothetical protein